MNDRPWMTALEMRFSAMASSRLEKSAATRGMFQEFYGIAINTLVAAETFYWDPKTVSACAYASTMVPLGTVGSRDLFDHRAQWWWMGTTSPFTLAIRPGEPPVSIVALSIVYGRDTEADDSPGIFVIGYEQLGRDCTPVVRTFWADGQTIAELFDKVDADVRRMSLDMQPSSFTFLRGVFLFVAAARAWLHQRVMTCSQGPVERHRRKQLTREHNTPCPSEVQVVQLRRVESQPHVAGEHGHVDWSCRWVVGGHWRNQPVKDGTKLLYIMPYVKGPEGKPLRIPKHTVYAVTR